MENAEMKSETWTDDKRYWWLTGVALMFIPLTSGQLAMAFNQPALWWFTPVFIFVIIPVLDWLLGEDRNNPPEWAVPQLEKDTYYRYAVIAAVPALYISYFWGVWMLAHGGLAWHAQAGLTVSLGMIAGISINTAHELGHKRASLEKWLAKIALAPSMYGNFVIEHNKGHHARVATPDDPASARFGENFWAFLPRSVIGAHVSAWNLEKKRLNRAGKSAFSWENENIQAWAFTVLLFGGITAWLGWGMLPYLVIAGIIGFSLLEAVNYLEHYGLCRQKKEDGRYERCQPHHSWNSNHRISNVALYQLQRHSDHHAHPLRPYQALRHFPDLPELPNGYAAMIPLAACPPLWFKIMNPKVVAHYKGDMSKANIKPAIRDKVIARYQTVEEH